MRPIPAFLALAALACGSGKPGATVEGTVHGQTLKPADAVSSPAEVKLGALTANVAAIVITDVGGACAKVTGLAEPKSAKALILFLADVNGFSAAAPGGPGTFTVYDPTSGGLPPAHVAVASWGVNDADCNQVADQSAVATSGSVKITSASGGAYGGTYTIGFDTGETVTGEFHAASCPGLATYLASGVHSCG